MKNPLPDKFKNKIITGDSEFVLKEFPDNCVDLIFTSPPYNFGRKYEDYNDKKAWQEYFDKLFSIFKKCIRILTHGGRIAVNIRPVFSDHMPTHHIISTFFLEQGLIWYGEILWEKNHVCKYSTWGSFKSPSCPYLKYTWEFIEVFAKGTLKHEGNGKQSDIEPREFTKWVYAKWEIAPESRMQIFNHPAMFPEELALRVIKLFSFPGDVVLDPFNGAGTTTLVAKKLGRVYVGIDISQAYCKIAQERLAYDGLQLF
jgi:DNA modification methylase